ncbi:UTP--glucose-1-phosphate uridylyltransferase [Hondaea fermentalgiana]|uniref:UTP--glucose-1-phosphate uridylyltransferase n=1 Tax=Hondaea fermentalgiana TaxID=2315210 RepID=A0A2R5GKQ2_9STRA|nr:UTP--glucose-1-phosphate uridylyltransferase [Hondaea fermentalgiana]|eukprot:GBG30308.1 UTP--glucose-1-phosphate uridylyltransferase [Hondaea fermentalgiana]
MNAHKSTENFLRMVESMAPQYESLMPRDSVDEFLRYLGRYSVHSKYMRELSIDDIVPIQEDWELCLEQDASDAAAAAAPSMDAPFIENLRRADEEARQRREKEKSGGGGASSSSSSAESASSGAGATAGVDAKANSPSGGGQGQKTKQRVKCCAYKSIPTCPDSMNLTHEVLNKLAILRLNGGLGTSMGCQGPKSVIEVRNSLSFLDMAVRQVEFLNTKHGVDVPLILMNSFNTDKETKRLLSRYDDRHVSIKTFCQSCFPKLDRSTVTPLANGKFTKSSQDMWYPPGHGDVYTSISRCGLLEELISMGKEYLFISNIDNLGATVDLNILYYLMLNESSFCMEVTKRERQDVSGGTLVEHKGKPLLLENSALPKVLGDTLRRDKRFDKFNTNNLWVNLRELQRLVSVKRSLDLQVIARDRLAIDGAGEEVTCLMFETAAGAAINLFDKVNVVVVPRSRFLPVKTTSDLFAVQSDLFIVKHGSLALSKRRTISPPVPTVKLGPCFRTVEEYTRRLPFGVPDLIDLEHLTVSGDVHFRNHVQLKGTVIIVAEEGSHIDICSGSVIRDKVITGNLRIMDH